MRSSSGSGSGMLGIPFPNFFNKSASSTDVRIKQEGFDSLNNSRPPSENFSTGAKLNKNASKSAEKYLPKLEDACGYDVIQRPSSSLDRPSNT